MADLTPYSTAAPFFGTMPTWITPEDAQRLMAYQLYESMYKNAPEAYRVVQRGSEQNVITVPSGKALIEATNRFLAKDWSFVPNPRLGTPQERLLLKQIMDPFFRREAMWSKFSINKRWGLVRGDAIWHVVADPNRPAGRRLSIYTVDPAMYFPIPDPVNLDRIIGCHLVEQTMDSQGTTIIKRQTYRKTEDGGITYELSWWQTGAWDDRNNAQELKPAENPPGPAVPAFPLPAQITSLPVYHVKNSPDGGPFGSSELQGIERLIAGVSQAISDNELALALDGLGMYVTTSGPPVDDEGNETNWNIGPGYVAEIDPEADWKRVQGVGSVTPVLDHVAYLHDRMQEAAGVPDIALGTVDTAVAESGISLAFKMGPILAKNAEKEQELLGTLDHLLYDLTTMWLPAYEGASMGAASAVSVIGDPIPVNRAEVIAEVSSLLTAGVISIAYAQAYLSEKLGFDFPDSMLADIAEEAKVLAAARNTDPFLDRIGRELDAAQGGDA